MPNPSENTPSTGSSSSVLLWIAGVLAVLLIAAGAFWLGTMKGQESPEPETDPEIEEGLVSEGTDVPDLLEKMMAEEGEEPDFEDEKDEGQESDEDTEEDTEGEAPIADIEIPEAPLPASFASFSAEPSKVTPKVKNYEPPQDLSEVSNAGDFEFSENAKDLLTENAFVVVPSFNYEFFPLYEKNRYEYIPSFITADSILHNYHLMFGHLLKTLEKEKLIPLLHKLNGQMVKVSLENYENLLGTEWENAAMRNLAFFSLANKLLDPTVGVHDAVAGVVDKELVKVKERKGISISAIMNIGREDNDSPDLLREDYTQYIPRGHYDDSERMRNYFKAMMWYGRLTFRFGEEDEVRSAVLITQSLKQGNNKNIWNSLYEPINFFVGKSDDVSFIQLEEVFDAVYPEGITAEAIANDPKGFNLFSDSLTLLDPPRVNSIPIFNAAIQPDRKKAIAGFRFMGQRFTIDASIFQRLMDREVEGRMLPMGLDVTAAMGSEEAYKILESLGETENPVYQKNMSDMKGWLKLLGTDIWTQNLYWGWLYSLLPLTEEHGEGYPRFMRGMAWARKQLNTYLGSWTELKHDTILYAKQAYAEMGGGWEPEAKDDRGYVEPQPELYGRLAGLIQMTIDGLKSRQLLSEQNEENLSRMKTLVDSLKKISEKELSNTPLSKADYELIRSYGGQLEHFWIEVNKEDLKDASVEIYLSENPAAIVADVATNPGGEVLEEATGEVYEIYVIVPIDGKLRLTKGAVYSYYEFTMPMAKRLTDKQWREMLFRNEAPDLPKWTQAFMDWE